MFENIDKDELLKLDNQLCFALYACSREVTKIYRPYLDKLGITYTQYITMMVLWEKNTMTAKELGNLLYLDSGTLTPLLKKLESAGFIQRKRGTEDERSLIVSITQKGIDLKKEAQEIPLKVSCGINLPTHEAVFLRESLKSLIKNINSCDHI